MVVEVLGALMLPVILVLYPMDDEDSTPWACTTVVEGTVVVGSGRGGCNPCVTVDCCLPITTVELVVTLVVRPIGLVDSDDFNKSGTPHPKYVTDIESSNIAPRRTNAF